MQIKIKELLKECVRTIDWHQLSMNGVPSFMKMMILLFNQLNTIIIKTIKHMKRAMFTGHKTKMIFSAKVS